jgi:phenylalanyl-tRNA synthetase beta chain
VRLDSLLKLPLRHPVAREISRFQAVERDFSFTFAESTSWHAIEAAIRSLNISELQRVGAVEIFRDAKKLPGRFSALVRVVFQSNDRTLVDTELAVWSAAIIRALEALGGVLRA